LQTRPDNEVIEHKICHELSKAWYNVDVKDAPRFDNQIFVDGQPVPVGQDGKVSLDGSSQNVELWLSL
jgi:hypothetical protein